MARDSKKAGGALPAPATAMGNAAAETSLPPGFRFHPSDEELISYYLKKKVQGKPMRYDEIGEVDICKLEPWDLAVIIFLCFLALDFRYVVDFVFFKFVALDKKTRTGTSMSRATKQGYWKVTGTDGKIRQGGDGKVTIGTMKTLVFHRGRSPNGLGTDWVMNEYHLAKNDEGVPSVLQANNTGSRYAPFLEEEWDDDNGERVAIHVPDDGPLPLCVLNKEAPLPLIQYKRKRRISSSQTTQDHRSFTETIIDSTASAEPLDISERIALSALNGMLDDLEKEQEPVVVDGNKINEIQQESQLQRKKLIDLNLKEDAPSPLCVVNKETPSPLKYMIDDLEKEQEPATKRINDLVLKENDEIVVFREMQERESMKAEMEISFLEAQIDALDRKIDHPHK
ncbi:NAC077 [Arabidopsis thaliana]|uniref:NAC077 n=1 Tax=Arabidopsis thaliana TaxID=3702 RepID=A0A178UM10_ARATH|nr:NAC077 [Arabidopsis thaliana]